MKTTLSMILFISMSNFAFADSLPTDVSERMISNCDLKSGNVNKIFPEIAAEVLGKGGISSGEMNDRKVQGVENSECSLNQNILTCEARLSDTEVAGFQLDLDTYARSAIWNTEMYYEKTVTKRRFFGFGSEYEAIESIEREATCDVYSVQATRNFEAAHP